MDIFTLTISVSLIVFVAIGSYAGKKVKKLDDYFVAGRRAPTLLIVGTLVGSVMSSVAFLGEAMLDGIQTSILRLEPKSERVAGMFPTIQLWVDQSRWIPIQSRLNEAGGDYQIVKYSDIVLNGRISNDVFNLDIPGDVIR